VHHALPVDEIDIVGAIDGLACGRCGTDGVELGVVE
jgi:hypothetical protein